MLLVAKTGSKLALTHCRFSRSVCNPAADVKESIPDEWVRLTNFQT